MSTTAFVMKRVLDQMPPEGTICTRDLCNRTGMSDGAMRRALKDMEWLGVVKKQVFPGTRTHVAWAKALRP